MISMCVLPVSITCENNGKQITTYAILDNCSQGSFVYEAVLGVKGTKTTLSLKTFHRKRSENTSAIPGIQAKGINGDDNWLRLPRLYARKELPVDKEEIGIPGKITAWEYLKPVTKEIVQNDGVCIGLLIGANCMKVLEPM